MADPVKRAVAASPKPAWPVTCDRYSPIENYPEMRAENGDLRPPPEAWACYRQMYDLSMTPSVRYFLEWPVLGLHLRGSEIRDVEELRKHPNALIPLHLIYTNLVVDPNQQMQFLIGEIHKRTGRPIRVLLPRRFFDGKFEGFFRGYDGTIGVTLHTEALSRAACFGRERDQGTYVFSRVPGAPQRFGAYDCAKRYYVSLLLSSVQHELGHYLMRILYKGKEPKFRGFGHDMKAATLANQKTSPQAAWAEGFAHAAVEPDLRRDHLLSVKDASKKSIQERISNEWLISSILMHFTTTFRHGEVERDMEKFQRVIASMERAGVQQSFQEFVVDYVHDYPEDKPALMSLLKIYEVVLNDREAEAFFSAPNYVKRSLKK